MNNKLLCSCVLCHNTITTNQLTIHHNSKQCKSGKLFKDSRLRNDKSLDCKFCDFVGKSANSITQHELYCKHNPDKRQKIPSYGMLGKQGSGSNVHIKAKRLGLPKPVVSAETRKKHSDFMKKNPMPYSSKEGIFAIENLLTQISDIDYGRVFYGTRNEYWLTADRERYYFYDCCFKDINLIVEYQGRAFHPKSLSENYSPPYKSMGTKEDVWNKDRLKEQLAKENGFVVEYIWSDNVAEDTARIVSKIRNINIS